MEERESRKREWEEERERERVKKTDCCTFVSTLCSNVACMAGWLLISSLGFWGWLKGQSLGWTPWTGSLLHRLQVSFCYNVWWEKNKLLSRFNTLLCHDSGSETNRWIHFECSVDLKKQVHSFILKVVFSFRINNTQGYSWWYSRFFWF